VEARRSWPWPRFGEASRRWSSSVRRPGRRWSERTLERGCGRHGSRPDRIRTVDGCSCRWTTRPRRQGSRVRSPSSPHHRDTRDRDPRSAPDEGARHHSCDGARPGGL